ncbi:MAG: zinc-ribbon domain-containing protein [Elusimicrobiota bacterium]|nr:zinc-ribbon domain-containing protein [Elusimicrobiota bacterium]
MKCPKCNTENKPETKFCKKCGTSLVIKPVWRPTWKWHLQVLVIIFAVLIGLFFLLNALFKPYMRKLPKDVTPWLQR